MRILPEASFKAKPGAPRIGAAGCFKHPVDELKIMQIVKNIRGILNFLCIIIYIHTIAEGINKRYYLKFKSLTADKEYMKTRPWPLVIIALAHIFGPVANLILSAALQHAPILTFFQAFIQTKSWWKIVDFFLLLPIAGVAIYSCKKWSYPVFISIAGITVYSNYQTWLHNPQLFPFSLFLLMVFLDVGFVSYFLVPAVAETYMNPKLRWWESKPRYRARFRGVVHLATASGAKEKVACVVTDVSEGGVFIKTPKVLNEKELFDLSFFVFGKQYSVLGHVVYRRAASEGSHFNGYGVQFHMSSAKTLPLRRLVKGLQLLGLESQNNIDLKKDFFQWFLRVLKTGKGLFPDVPVRRSALPAQQVEPSPVSKLKVVKESDQGSQEQQKAA